jgi:hypothetical protein
MVDRQNQNPGWHSSKWYANHPEVPRPASPHKNPVQLQSLSIGLWIPRAGGISLLGGFGLMRAYFWMGVAVVYVSLGLLVWDLCIDPLLIKGRAWIQIVGIGIVFVLFDLITIGIVGANAPITFNSYALRSGNYSDGIDIGGIPWNSHFTNLTVAVVNPSDDDYSDMDIAIVPDVWTYKAVVIGDNSQCKLVSIGGNTILTTITKGGGRKMTLHRLGDKFEAEDEMGDVFTPLATNGGYRLICSKFPTRFTIKLVFATVAINQDVLRTSPKPNLKTGEWGGAFSEWSGVKSEFDMLGIRPSPSRVAITGKYVKIMKPYSISTTVGVENGN